MSVETRTEFPLIIALVRCVPEYLATNPAWKSGALGCSQRYVISLLGAHAAKRERKPHFVRAGPISMDVDAVFDCRQERAAGRAQAPLRVRNAMKPGIFALQVEDGGRVPVRRQVQGY